MQKIAICGKGGVGKSFMVYAITKALQKKGFSVCVVDTDESNVGLHRLFGFDVMPKPFMDFLGGKKSVQQTMIKRFSSGQNEPKMSVIEKGQFYVDDIDNEYIIKQENLSFITIGKIQEPMEGCACPMGAVSREFLEKIMLHNNEMLIVDMEAGVEHFGRGVEKGIDTIITISEPSRESLEIAGKVVELSHTMNKKNYVIINKVPQGLEEKVKGIALSMQLPVIGMVHHDPEVFISSIDGSIDDISKALDEVYDIIESIV